MAYPEPIRVEGLAEFSRSLRRLDNEAPKQLRNVFNSAADAVVTGARKQLPRSSGRAQNTVKARSTRTAARVSEGSKAVPYVAWLDFGGRVGRGRSIERPFVKEGRALYKTYFGLLNSGVLEKELAEGLTKIVDSAGLGG